METEVTCYAGTRYPERPRSFSFGGERLEVGEVERQERTIRGFRFRVRAVDGRRFWLTYSQVGDSWDVRRSRRDSEEGDSR